MSPIPPPVHKAAHKPGNKSEPAKKVPFKAKGWLTQATILVFFAIPLCSLLVEIYESIQESRAKKAEAARANLKPFYLPYNATPKDVMVNQKDGLTYVRIPSGRLEFGCSAGDKECYSDEKPPLIIPVNTPYWIGQTLVTQAAFQSVTGSNPSHWKGADLPVESVTWEEAVDYCGAIGGRLPTEVEWEWAARGGTNGSRYGPLNDIAWYHANSGGKTHVVKTKAPNAYGLYDMIGDLRQWTAEWYKLDQTRMLRGGSIFADPKTLRASYRFGNLPFERRSSIGFRCIEK